MKSPMEAMNGTITKSLVVPWWSNAKMDGSVILLIEFKYFYQYNWVSLQIDTLLKSLY